MIIITLFKEICNEVTKTVKDCMGHVQQARCEHQKAVAEKKRIAAVQEQQQANLRQTQYNMQLTTTHSQLLNKLFATAFNALPSYQRISQREIDPLVLRNQCNGSYWTVTVNISSGSAYTPSSRKHLLEQLQLIFDNLYRETRTAFDNYLATDCYQYCCNLAAACYGQTSIESDDYFMRNYAVHYNENSHGLYRIQGIGVTATSSALQIHYSVSSEAVEYYAPRNYFLLRNSILNA